MKFQKQANNPSKLKLLFAWLLILSFPTFGFSQTPEAAETSAALVPEQAMEQIVRRVLVWNFKPRARQKVIYLAEQNIKKSWLPEIKNIDFRLLPEAQVKQGKSVYFFSELTCSDNSFMIAFGFGDPECNANGSTWHFRLTKQKARLWNGGNFGSNCFADA